MYKVNLCFRFTNSKPMSSLSLPDDDDGPTIMVDSAEPSANPGGKNSCSHPASKPAVKKKGARKRPAAAKEPPAPAASGDLGLPSEDEGPTLELVPGPIGVPEPSKSEDSQESDLLKTYDDSTLKAAAAKIPSCVQHPYTDLEAPLRANPPCHKDLQCTVWEIFSVNSWGAHADDHMTCSIFGIWAKKNSRGPF